MKRAILLTIMSLFVGIMVFAQQAGGSAQPSSAQVKQNAQQSATQAKSNSSQFESTLAALKAQNVSNNDAAAYRELKARIDQLEARIIKEQEQMQARLDQGQKVSANIEDHIQQLIELHKKALAEMEKLANK